MKILYYSPNPSLNLSDRTGYGTHMREVIHAFRELGHEVHPVIAGGTGPKGGSARTPEIKRVIKALAPGYVWESAKDWRLLKSNREAYASLIPEVKMFMPDLIYERTSYLQNGGSRAAEQMGIPHRAEVNAPFAEEKIYFSGRSSFMGKARQMEQEVLQKAEKVIVVSSALKDFLVERYSISPGKVLITPNAINPSSVDFSGEEAEKLRSDLGLTGCTVVGFVGSFFGYHGIDLLLRAFQQSLGANASLKLLIVGDGHILGELRSLCRELKIESSVIFTGSVAHSQIFNYIHLMDICTMARSNWYGSPVKIFEYGAMGKAIIAPDVAPVRDVMADGQDGILVKPDVHSISKGLDFLLQHPEKRKQMGLSFQKKVLQNYNWKSVAERILS